MKKNKKSSTQAFFITFCLSPSIVLLGVCEYFHIRSYPNKVLQLRKLDLMLSLPKQKHT